VRVVSANSCASSEIVKVAGSGCEGIAAMRNVEGEGAVKIPQGVRPA